MAALGKEKIMSRKVDHGAEIEFPFLNNLDGFFWKKKFPDLRI